MIVSVTGHQPPVLGGFSDDVLIRLRTFAHGWIERERPSEIVSGMAPGWDLAMAEAALDAGVPLTAALAWPDQGKNWPEDALSNLQSLLARAAHVHIHQEKRSRDMWTNRDLWVLERGTKVLALWNGQPGGTASAVAAAVGMGRPIVNLWDEWCVLMSSAS